MVEALRVSAGLTQAQLSEGAGVSQTVISQIETGAREASPDALSELAKSLAVDVVMLEMNCPAPTIRHTLQTSLPARAVRKLIADLAIAHARIALIGGVPETDVPIWRFDPSQHFGGDRARGIRRAWDVPEGPVNDIVGLLEDHGIICVLRDLGAVRVPAVLSTADSAPTIMFIDPSRSTSELRWAMAHEVGHLAVHEAQDKSLEGSADDFASELLIPRRQLRASMREDTAALAADWGVPQLELLRHAKEGRLISGAAMRRERAGEKPTDRSRLAGPSWLASAVRGRTRAPGETLAAVAASAFLSVDDLRRDYLAGSRSA